MGYKWALNKPRRHGNLIIDLRNFVTIPQESQVCQVCQACSMGMLRVSSSIRIRNLDGFLQNDFHLKSSFDKTKYIFDQSIRECNGHFDDWFPNTKTFLCDI